MNPECATHGQFSRRLVLGLASFVMLPAAFLFAQTTPPPSSSSTAPTGTSETANDTVVLSPFQVNTEQDTGYNVVNSVGATLLNTPIADTPQYVTVLNGNFMKDVGTLTLVDAAKYVAGAEASSSPNSGNLILRGWAVNALNSTRDGLQDPNILTNVAGGTLEMSPIDRIEILKGPSGTLYGSHQAGGIVNLVSKKPLDTQQTTVTGTVGSFDLYRLDLDSTGPLDANKKFLYRFIWTVQRAKDYQGVRDDHWVINPQLTWRMDPDTTMTVSYIFSRPIVPGNPYVWFMDKDHNISYFLPKNLLIPDTDSVKSTVENEGDFDFDHGFNWGNSRWNTRLKVRYANISQYWWVSTFGAANYQFVDADGDVIGNITTMDFSDPNWADMIIKRTGQERWQYLNQVEANYALTGQVDLGPTSHTTLVYVDDILHEDTFHQLLWNLTPLDLNNRVYYGDTVYNQESNFHTGTDNRTDYNSFAFGAQDNISLLNDHIIVVAGVRYDWLDQIVYDNVGKTETQTYRQNWSDRFGLVAKPIKDISLFYNYAQTFTPLTGVNQFTNQPYLNETSVTNEGGVKVDLAKSLLSVTASVFAIKFDNQPITIGVVEQSNGNLVNETVQEGISWATGWDVDFTSVPIKNLELLGGFGNVNSKTVTGAHQRGVPIGFSYKMWAKYSFTERLKGLYVGLGMQHEARKDVDGSGKSGWLPAYNEWDGMLGYSWKNWDLQLNVYNLANANYATLSVATYIIYASDPRNFRLSLSHKF